MSGNRKVSEHPRKIFFPSDVKKEVIDFTMNKISYKAMISCKNLNSFFTKEQREEEE